MLTKLRLKNLKRFGEAEIELGQAVIFVGPNNSGKTSALQALALWELGVRKWLEKRGGKAAPEKRPGVTINRRDLIALPIRDAALLWKDLHLRDGERVGKKTTTKNVRIEIDVEGVSDGNAWRCGLEFDYANEESLHCRPIRLEDGSRMPVPEAASLIRTAFLPPMSGLATNEIRLDPGAVQVRIGEGRTAEVLRNLCYRVYEKGAEDWGRLISNIRALFGVSLDPPQYVVERGEIFMSYTDQGGTRLDLSSAGRGLQQTLLLLSYLQANPRAVLLLDEPDAHLEILRQRQIYQIVTRTSAAANSQVIAASHSEVLLNEAADKDVVVAFVGAPHRIDDRGSQVSKALKEIGFEHYYLAEQKGWVLYLEGSTDLSILKTFAEVLNHPAMTHLQRPFVHYVSNQPKKAQAHFYGVREAKSDLVGVAVFDRLDAPVDSTEHLKAHSWERREIENYLTGQEVLEAYAASLASGGTGLPLFDSAHSSRNIEVMQECIRDNIPPRAMRDHTDSWWADVKASDDFLDPLFAAFFEKLGLPNLMTKTDYHQLARFVPSESIPLEVRKVLDLIESVAINARPLVEKADLDAEAAEESEQKSRAGS
jgi:hypothetical protein